MYCFILNEFCIIFKTVFKNGMDFAHLDMFMGTFNILSTFIADDTSMFPRYKTAKNLG